MRASDFVTEIVRLPKRDYVGGKYYLHPGSSKKQFYKLPGDAGLLYTIENTRDPIIKIWTTDSDIPDPKPTRYAHEFKNEFAERLAAWKKRQETGEKIPKIIGKLSLETVPGFPIRDALQVGTITVDEDYRGMGIAKALYGIVLTILKRTLVSGDSQTPGGRRNWVSLSQIPGVEIKGYIGLDDSELSDSSGKKIDIIMGQLGGQYIGESRYGMKYFAFDVQPNSTGKELAAVVNQNLAKVYDGQYSYTTGLYAVWTGQ